MMSSRFIDRVSRKVAARGWGLGVGNDMHFSQKFQTFSYKMHNYWKTNS
jgi:hypothetical protein